MNRVVITLLVLLMFGCGGTKKSNETTRIQLRDSVFKRTEIVTMPKFENTVNFNHICDTIKGAKELVYKTVIEKDTVEVKVKDNQLSIRIGQMSQELSKKEYDYQLLERENEKLKEEVRTKPSGNMIWWLLGSGVLNVLLLLWIFRRFLPLPIPF